METGPIASALLAFALPVLAAQLLQELYNVTDCMVVGHFGGENALAATGVAGLVLSVLINFFVGFSSGISAVTARLFGACDYPTLKRTLATVFRSVIAFGLGVSALVALGADRILMLMKCPAAVLPAATLYLRICACGLTAQLLYNVGTAFLRSVGDTRTPLLFYLLSVACNLALDVLLVIGLRRGIAGAAVATLFSQWLLALLVLIHLWRLNDDFALRLLGPGMSLSQMRKLLAIGLPAGMQALFMSISSFLIQTVINRFGPDAIAGMTLFAKLEGCIYLPTFAYGIALTSFVGQNLGAGRKDRIRRAVGLSVKLTAAVILPLSLLLVLASPLLLRLFTRDAEILRNAGEAVRFTLPLYLVYSINQVYLGAIKGLGNTSYPMVCTLICYSLFRVLWCLLLIPAYPTMRVVYLSYTVSFFLMLALLLPKYRRMMAAGEERK